MTSPTAIVTKAPPASGCLFVLAAPSGGAPHRGYERW